MKNDDSQPRASPASPLRELPEDVRRLLYQLYGDDQPTRVEILRAIEAKHAEYLLEGREARAIQFIEDERREMMHEVARRRAEAARERFRLIARNALTVCLSVGAQVAARKMGLL